MPPLWEIIAPYLKLIFLTVLPYIELRGGIPLGIGLGMDPLWVFIVCTLANLLIIFQNVYGFTDSVDVCKFSTFAVPLDAFAGMYSGMTGVPYFLFALMLVILLLSNIMSPDHNF